MKAHKKVIQGLLFSILLVIAGATLVDSAEVTITTYYPAPYGEYQELYVSGNVGIGTTDPGVYKLYVNGSFYATSVSASVKSFVIDHPLDPERKYLVHGTLEGPELAVFYRGEAQLVDGELVITLPDYFEALTGKEGRTVQLAAKGKEPYLLGYTGIEEGKFKIYGTKPDSEFSWEVKAVRTDVEPLKVERPKKEEHG